MLNQCLRFLLCVLLLSVLVLLLVNEVGDSLFVPFGFHSWLISLKDDGVAVTVPCLADRLFQKVSPEVQAAITQMHLDGIDADEPIYHKLGMELRRWLSAAR